MAENNGIEGTVRKKMLDILSDGMPHTAEELHACLWDELSPVGNIRKHLSLLNQYLKPKAMIILHQSLNKRWHYRLTRLLVNPNDGRY
jgi:hypothetical protein